MLESKVQAKLIKKLEKDGWYVVKIISCNKNGFPDLACFKGNEYKLIEVKAKNGKLSPIQIYRHKEMKDKNLNVFVKYLLIVITFFCNVITKCIFVV